MSATVVFDSYWRFAAERQRVYERRLNGDPQPWTDDPTLSAHKFTNVFRACDRVPKKSSSESCSSSFSIRFRLGKS